MTVDGRKWGSRVASNLNVSGLLVALLTAMVGLAAESARGQSPPGYYLVYQGGYPNYGIPDGNLSNSNEWYEPVTGTPYENVPQGGDDAIVDVPGLGSVYSALDCWGAGLTANSVPLDVTASLNIGAGGLALSGDAYGPSALTLDTSASTSGGLVTLSNVNLDAAVIDGAWWLAAGNTGVNGTSVNSNGLLVTGTLDVNSGSNITTGQVGTLPPASSGTDFYSATTGLQIEASSLYINSGSATCNGDTIIGTVAAQTGSPNIGLVSVSGGGSFTTTGVAHLGVINPNGNNGPPGLAGTGTVIVSGSGSLWHAEQDVRAGDDTGGNGFIDIFSGATLQLDAGVNLRLGSAAGGAGYLTFDTSGGSSPTLTGSSSSSILVGDQSTGSLTIQNGSTITQGGSIDVGSGQGSYGTLSVADALSSLICGGGLTVGDSGTGTATVTGGILTANGAFIMGNAGGGTGTASVVGGGTLNLNADSFIGNVLNGSGTISVGATDASSAGNLTATGVLNVGENGTGEVDVYSGKFNCNGTAANNLILGDGTTGVGTVNVTGSNASISAGGIIVGNNGTATLNIQNNAQATFGALTVSMNDTSALGSTATVSGDAALIVNGKLTVASSGPSNGTFTVTGTGSTVTVNGELVAADSGTGTVNVLSNATLNSESGVVANAFASTGTLNVTGSSSMWNDSGDLTIGNNGDGFMTVSSGATLQVGGDLSVASTSTSTGLLTLDGASTNLIFGNGDLTVGSSGGGSMYVQNGMSANASGSSVTIGDQTGGNGAITVTDDNTLFTTGDLTVGSAGTGYLYVEQNATLHTTGDATIGDESGGKGTAIVQGAAWNIDGSLTIGGNGNGQLTVASEGSVNVSGSDITLGDESGGKGTLIFNGDDATVGFNGETTVGDGGTGTLSVEGGATVVLGPVTLGVQQTASGKLTVDGTGVASSLEVGGDLDVAEQGSGSVSVTNGGSLLVDGDAVIGDDAKGGNAVSCSVDLGSNLNVYGDLTIGNQAAASMTVDHGSEASDTGTTTVGGLDGGAGKLTVQDTSSASPAQPSTLTFGKELDLGVSGNGMLAISNGGVVEPAAGAAGVITLGDHSDGVGTITVDGATSLLVANQLAIGGTMTAAGGTGSLKLTTDAAVEIYSTVMEWPSGSINVKAGSLTIGDQSLPAAVGTVRVDPGGELEGFGKISGKVVNSGGRIVPGGDPGTLEIDGDFEQDSGTLDLIMAGSDPSEYNQLIVDGDIALNGTVLLDFQGGFAPLAGETFTLITADDPFTVTPDQIQISGLEPGWQYQIDNSNDGLTINSLSNGIAVPEPTAAGTLGMLAVSLLGRRKRRSCAVPSDSRVLGQRGTVGEEAMLNKPQTPLSRYD